MAKKGWTVAGLAAGILGLIYLVGGKAKSPPLPPGEGQEGASLVIKLYKADGTPVPHNSPYVVAEGGSYFYTVSVRNDSVRSGQPSAASLTMQTLVAVAGQLLVALTERSDSYGPGEVLAFRYNFTVPDGMGGLSGTVRAIVLSPPPNVAVITEANEVLQITDLAIEYRATVVLR